MHVLRSFQTLRTGTFHGQNDLVWIASTRSSLTGHWRLPLRPGAQLISQWEASGGAQGCGQKSASYHLCFCPGPDLFRWAPPLRSSAPRTCRTAQQITRKNTGSLAKIKLLLESIVPWASLSHKFKLFKCYLHFLLRTVHLNVIWGTKNGSSMTFAAKSPFKIFTFKCSKGIFFSFLLFFYF